jgi:nitrite reductase/ring-hydroxylating ferredoxin subunit
VRRFRPVRDVVDLANESPTRVSVDGDPILLWRAGDGVYATEAFCPHRGFPLTHATLDGHQLRCALHGATFDIRTGQGCCYELRVYETRVIDGRVFIGPELGSWWHRLLRAVAPPSTSYRPYVRPGLSSWPSQRQA